MKDWLMNKNNRKETFGYLVAELEDDDCILITTAPLDKTLKGRQRALAQVWYSQIGEHLGESTDHATALCKYLYGLKLITAGKPDLEAMVRRALDGHNYEAKLEVIERYSEWFPLLRANGGLSTEDTGKYLNLMVVNFAKQGLELRSTNEDQLLFCKEANR